MLIWPSYRNATLLTNSVSYRSSFTFVDAENKNVKIDFDKFIQTRQGRDRNIKRHTKWHFMNGKNEWVDYDEDSNKKIETAYLSTLFVDEFNQQLFNNLDKIKEILNDEQFFKEFALELETGENKGISEWQEWASQKNKSFPNAVWDVH